jgi:hypothetical protein
MDSILDMQVVLLKPPYLHSLEFSVIIPHGGHENVQVEAILIPFNIGP